jgi:hypothetical protein
MTPVIRHYLHVYQRPKQGTSFLRRYLAYNYQHTITNRGGFDTASCDIAVQSENEGQKYLNQYLGCFVAIYVDNPAVPDLGRFINRITFNSGGASYTISLDEMANRVSVVYTGATNVAAETTVVNNTISQAIYGIKQDQIELGVDPSAARKTTSYAILHWRSGHSHKSPLPKRRAIPTLFILSLLAFTTPLSGQNFLPATTTAHPLLAAKRYCCFSSESERCHIF